MILYWKLRAQLQGRDAVLHQSHGKDKYDAVTVHQLHEIFPIVHKHLNGDERICLDFGCGPGRFTRELAELIHGKTIGVDIIEELLSLAPKHKDVEYRLMKYGKIPVAENCIDVLWCCLVLGGVPKNLLLETVNEMMRVLKPGGLLVLVENISEIDSTQYWHYWSVIDFQKYFKSVELKCEHTYLDVGQTIAVMTGRKK